MCTLPDGMKTDTIQYKPSFSPSHWYSEYQIHEKNKVPIDKLDNVSLLECATVKKEDEQLVFQYFDKDLEAALKIVEGELNPESLKDEIDDLVGRLSLPQLVVQQADTLLDLTNLNRAKCEKCSYSASNSGNLKTHIMAVHDGIKNYSCNLCNYTAASKVQICPTFWHP